MGTNFDDKKWGVDPDTGEHIPPPLVQEFLDDLIEVQKTSGAVPDGWMRLWAAENGVHIRTVRKWKADERFRQLWSEQAGIASPERYLQLMETLFGIATSNDENVKASDRISAIDRYMRMSGHYDPKQGPASQAKDADVDLSAMSDEELEAFLTESNQ